MSVETILLILVLVAGFYTAWNIGANDVANAMGTSVGSGAFTLRQAIVIAAILELTPLVMGLVQKEPMQGKSFDIK